MAAILAATALLVGLQIRASFRLKRFAPALALLNLPEASRGTVLQQQVFARPDCLPIYGSSELAIDQPTRADHFFRRKQHGFDAFVFGQPGDRCLAMLQELAALGNATRGKKVAVFLSPVWFLPTDESERRNHAAHKQFAAVFSPLQTGRLIEGGTLDPALKCRIATRLLDYGTVIQERSPLLAVALEAIRNGSSWPQRCLFATLSPWVGMQNRTLMIQERCHWLEVTHDHSTLRRVGTCYRSRRKHLEWTQLEADVDHMEGKHAFSTFYSRGPAPVDSPELRHFPRPLNQRDRDAEFVRRMNAAPEWSDLELLLAVARKLDIHLLLIGQPINGLLSDSDGVTPQARWAYYRRLSRTATAYQIPLRDFSAFEEDRTFFRDVLHPSAAAWVHYDEALAQFFRPENP